MLGDELAGNQGGKKRAAVGDVVGKMQAGSERVDGGVFVARIEQVQAVEDVEASEGERVSRVFDGLFASKGIIQTPIAFGENGGASHDFKGEFIFLDDLSEFRIVVFSPSGENRVQFRRLVRGNRGILHHGKGGPVAQGGVPFGCGALRERGRCPQNRRDNEQRNRSTDGHGFRFSSLSTASALSRPRGIAIAPDSDSSESSAASKEGESTSN